MKFKNWEGKKAWEKIKSIRLKEWLIAISLAILLLVMAFTVFRKDKPKTSVVTGTTSEQRLAALVQEIGGINATQVMIGEGENGEKSVVIVCDGEKDIRMIMDVREAAAALVGTSESNVKIYFKENY